MGVRNTDTGYGSVARFFHWSLAALFLFQFGSIVAFRFFGQDPPEVAWDILNWHKTSGVLILMLGLCRLLWRWSVALPSWPSGFLEWDKTLSHFAERGLYTALFVMTISGLVIELAGGHYVPFLGLFYLDNIAPYFHPGAVSSTQPVVAAREAASLPRVSHFFIAVHVVFAYAVVALVSIHVGHVLRHQWGLRDGLLDRMLPGRRGRG